MSKDDPFSVLKNAWQKGWQSPPDTGPSVGRGLFSNWFLSEKDRELRELEELYTEVRSSFDVSEFANSESLFDATAEVLIDIYKEGLIPLEKELVSALYDVVNDLLGDEFYAFPEITSAAWQSLQLQDRADLRNLLLHKAHVLADPGKALGLGGSVVNTIVYGVLNDANTEGVGEDVDPEALQFQTPLVDRLPDPALTIHKLIGSLFLQPALDAGLFAPLRKQIENRVYLASGINPSDMSPTKKLVMPIDAKMRSPSALAETYLAGTPFVDLLEAPLPVSIPNQVRFEHCHIVGGTGHGKTQLLQKLIHHDLTREDRPSVVVIDSQGDLIRTLTGLSLFSPDADYSLTDDLILIDPDDIEFPVALNLFAYDQSRMSGYDSANRERVFNSIVDLYDYVFSALLGAELTQKQGVVFRYIARLMLEIPGATIQTLRELMEDGRPFKAHMEKLDGSARHFFQSEFFSTGFAATKKQILRRLWGVLSNPVFERMFSNTQNKIDIFDALNSGKIIFINTAKDLLKPEGCSIFGRFFIAKIAEAALERATLPEDQRKSAFIYVDEAQDYFDDTIEHLLSQARKYRVGLTLAHQNLDQLPTKLRASVMASTSLKFVGGVSAKDARALAQDMNTDDEFLRAMRKRRGSTEFATFVKNRTERALRISLKLGEIDALPKLSSKEQQALIETNRERYCSTRSEVAELIDKSASKSKAFDIPAAPQEIQSLSPPEEISVPDPIPKPPAQTRRVRDDDPYITGLGGKEHKYLQQLIRRLAQDRGFKATVEMPTKDKSGSIDVALIRDDLLIGCEISVTTDAAHEYENVTKCFASGCQLVVLIVQDRRKRIGMERDIREKLPVSTAANFHVYGPEDIPAFLDIQAAQLASSEKTTRGYRVKVIHKPLPPEEAEQKRNLINRVLAKSILKPKDT